MKNKTGKAIVIGSSMAGLWAARICADFFDSVILLEQDEVDPKPAHRKGVPQDHQLHILLPRGYEMLQTYFPGAVDRLREKGALAGDIGHMLKWYHEGGYRPQCDTGLHTVMMSRPLLEYTVREMLLEQPQVRLMANTRVLEFLRDGDTITGVETADGPLAADLVIDARGLASKLPLELEYWGFEKPETERVRVNVRYTSCLFPRDPDFRTLININTKPPHNTKHGTIQPIEGDRMIVMVQGRSNDEPPRDVDSLKAYTRELENQEVYNTIKDLEPLTEVHSYHIPFVRWIHYERLKRFPEGILPLGDAVCRLNPVYGQGISSAAIQAGILEQVLKRKGTRGIWKPYLRQVAKAIKTPWELTVAEDFKFPETEGKAPQIPALLERYFNKLSRVMNNDPVIYRPFLRVLAMISAPTVLLRPGILWRVLWAK